MENIPINLLMLFLLHRHLGFRTKPSRPSLTFSTTVGLKFPLISEIWMSNDPKQIILHFCLFLTLFLWTLDVRHRKVIDTSLKIILFVGYFLFSFCFLLCIFFYYLFIFVCACVRGLRDYSHGDGGSCLWEDWTLDLLMGNKYSGQQS